MQASDLIVEVRDKSLTRLGIIKPEDYNLSLSPAHNAAGEWTLTLPTEHPLCNVLLAPGSGIIVTGPDDVLLSGPMVKPTYSAATDDLRGSVTFTGVSDSIILADALCYPQPSNSDVATQSVGNDTRTMVAESLMHKYVSVNIGPEASAARKNPFLIMGEDSATGASLTKSPRFDVLNNVLTEIVSGIGLDGVDGTDNNIGYRVIQRADNLVFETYRTLDKSKTVRLTLNNGRLASQSVEITAPTITRAIVAGQGWATSRKHIERTNTTATDAEAEWGRRIETYVDGRDTNITSELQTAGDEALADGGFTSTVVQAVPVEDDVLRYGVDWNLGDMLGVEIAGTETSMLAAGVAIKADTDGVRIGVLFGDATTATTGSARGVTSKLPTALEALEKRLSFLERYIGQDVA